MGSVINEFWGGVLGVFLLKKSNMPTINLLCEINPEVTRKLSSNWNLHLHAQYKGPGIPEHYQR